MATFSNRSDYYKAINAYKKQPTNYSNVYLNPSDDLNQVSNDNLAAFAYKDTELQPPVIDVTNSAEVKTALDDDNDTPWYERTWNTVKDTGLTFLDGILNFFDSIGDFFINTAGAIGGAFGADTTWADEAANFDWQSYVTNTVDAFDPFNIFTGQSFTDEFWEYDNIKQKRNKYMQDNFVSELGDTASEVFHGAVEGIGNMLPSVVLGVVTGGGAMPFMIANAGMSQFNETYQQLGRPNINEAGYWQSIGTGAASGAVEYATEKLVGPVLSKIGLGVNAVGGFSKLTAPVKGKVASTIAKTFIEEGVEETASALAQPLVESIAYGREALEQYKTSEFWADAGKQGLIGGISGAAFGGVSHAQKVGHFGKYGSQLVDVENEKAEIAQQMSKIKDKSSAKYQKLAEQYGQKYIKSQQLAEQVNKFATDKQAKNVLDFLGNPQAYMHGIQGIDNENTVEKRNVLNQSIQNTINQLDTPEKLNTYNLFGSLQGKYGSDLELEYSDQITEKALYDPQNKKIIVNTKNSGEFNSLLTHEYISHVVFETYDSAVGHRGGDVLFNEIKDTNWYKQNANTIKQQYAEEIGTDDDVENNSTFRSEVIAHYVQYELSSNNLNDTQVQSILTDILTDNNFKNKFRQLFKKDNSFKIIKQLPVLQEMSKIINLGSKATSINKLSQLLGLKKAGDVLDTAKAAKDIYNTTDNNANKADTDTVENVEPNTNNVVEQATQAKKQASSDNAATTEQVETQDTTKETKKPAQQKLTRAEKNTLKQAEERRKTKAELKEKGFSTLLQDALSSKQSESMTILSKDHANVKKERVITHGQVSKAIDVVTDELTNKIKGLFSKEAKINVRFKGTSKKALTDILQKAYNLSKDVELDKETKHFVRTNYEFVETARMNLKNLEFEVVEGDTTTIITFESLIPNIYEQQEFIETLQEVMNTNATEAKVHKLNRIMSEKVDVFKKTIKSVFKTYSKMIKLAKSLDGKRKLTFSGKMPIRDLTIFKEALKGLRMSSKTRSISAKSLTHLVRVLKAEYSENTNRIENFNNNQLETGETPYIVHFNPTIKNIVDHLYNEVFVDGEMKNRAFTIEEISEVGQLLNEIDAEIKYFTEERMQKRLDYAKGFHTEVSEATQYINTKRNKNMFSRIFNKVFSATSAPANKIEVYFGKNSKLYNLFTEDWLKAENIKIDTMYKLQDEVYERLIELSGTTTKELQKYLTQKIEVQGVELTLNEVCGIISVYETNPDLVMKNGFTYRDPKTKTNKNLKFEDVKDIEELINKLPEKLDVYRKNIITKFFPMAKQIILEHVNKDRGIEMPEIFLEDGKAYYPTSVSSQNELGFTKTDTFYTQGLSLSNPGFLQKRVKHTSPFDVIPMTQTIDSYINTASNYIGLSPYVDQINTVLNTKIDGTNVNSMMKEIIPEFELFTKQVVNAATGGRPNINADKMASKLMSNSITFTLGANPKTIMNQLGAMFTWLHDERVSSKILIKSFGNIVLNLKNYNKIRAEMMEMSPLIKQRFLENEKALALTLSNKMGRMKKFFTKLISKTDEAVIVLQGYYIAREIYKANPNKQTLAQVMELLIMNTQSNNNPMFISPLRAGYKGQIMQFIFAPFSSDVNNTQHAFYAATIGFSNSRKRIEFRKSEITKLEKQLDSETDVNKQTDLQNQINDLKEQNALDEQTYSKKNQSKRLAHFGAQLVLTSTLITLVSELFARLNGRKEWEEELLTPETLTSFFTEATLSWIPYVNTIANAIENKTDVSIMPLDTINEIVDSITNLANLVSGDFTNQQLVKTIKSTLMTVSRFIGFPLDNLYDDILMGVRVVSPQTANEIKGFLEGYSSSILKSNYSKSLKVGAISSAKGNLNAYMTMYSSGRLEAKSLDEIVRLAQLGYKVTPSAMPTTIADPTTGEDIKVTFSQQKDFQKIYSSLNEQLEKMFKTNIYNQLDDEQKAQAISKLSKTYYNYAKASVFKDQYDLSTADKLTRVLVSKGGELSNIEKIVLYYAKLQNIQATVTATRKELILQELNKSGLSTSEKLLILVLLGYTADEKYLTMLNKTYGFNETNTIFA